jgi:hypothetical protein
MDSFSFIIAAFRVLDENTGTHVDYDVSVLDEEACNVTHKSKVSTFSELAFRLFSVSPSLSGL